MFYDLEDPSKFIADAAEILDENGVFIAPSQYETVFLSDAHTDMDITSTLGAYGLSLKQVKN